MKAICCYLSGPMTGLPEANFPKFNAVAARLRSYGYTVLNPAELNHDRPARRIAMRRDIEALMRSQIVATLNGWKDSPGAQLEVQIATELGLKVVPEWLLTAKARLHVVSPEWLLGMKTRFRL